MNKIGYKRSTRQTQISLSSTRQPEASTRVCIYVHTDRGVLCPTIPCFDLSVHPTFSIFSYIYKGHAISFQTFFLWELLLIAHTWNSSALRSNLLQLQCTCFTVPTTSGRPHGSPLVWACQWPSSQHLSSPQLSHNDSLWAKGITQSHREQGLDYREEDELSSCPSWSNSLWPWWGCGLVHCPGGNATDPIWRVLASSDGISCWTPLKPQHSNPSTPLLIPHKLPAFLESFMPLKNWCSIYARCSKSSLKHSIRFCDIFPSFKQTFFCISFF